MVDTNQIWKYLEEVSDPEIPVLTVNDLGIVRNVSIEGGLCKVTITPTYSGCPAMKRIEDDIIEKLKDCLLYTSPRPRDLSTSRMPSSA